MQDLILVGKITRTGPIITPTSNINLILNMEMQYIRKASVVTFLALTAVYSSIPSCLRGRCRYSYSSLALYHEGCCKAV